MFANLAPVKARRLSCDQPEEDDDDDQKKFLQRRCPEGLCLTLAALILDQLD